MNDHSLRVKQENLEFGLLLNEKHDDFIWVDSSSILNLAITDSMAKCFKNELALISSNKLTH